MGTFVSSETEIQYRPDDRFRASPLSAIRRISDEIWRLKFQVGIAFSKEFKSGYRGTALGIFWNILIPLLPIIVYSIMASSRFFPVFDGIDVVVAISFNATLWYFFVGCVQIPIDTVRSRNQESMKTSVPLSVSVVASFGRLAFESLVRVALLMSFVVLTREWFSFNAWGAIPVFFFATIFFLGSGLFLAILGVASPDVHKVSGPILSLGIFVSGVIFPLPTDGGWAVVGEYNPFAVAISSLRSILFANSPDVFATHDAISLVIWSVVSVCIFLWGARVFYVMEFRIRGVS